MKTNKKQFNLFVEECKKWIKFFSLAEYRIEFFISDEANGTRGQTEGYGHLMAADIIFPTELHKETDIRKIRKAAFHEVCEVMLLKLRKFGDDYYNFEIINKEVHTVIRRLENSIFN